VDVFCPYCGTLAGLIDSAQIHGRSFGLVWACLPCKAWVGVHKSDNRPLGTLANAETRYARGMAHSRFDPLWKAQLSKTEPKYRTRGRAYSWLAERLGVPVQECHIGLFDLVTCVRVVEICARESPPKAGDQP
jgi:hypothetical protein